MKKRIYLGMLALCLALTATACGSSKDTTDTAADTAKTQENTEDKKAEVGTGRLVSVENVDKYITIGEYKGLILDNTVSAITDEDVQVQINEDLQDKAEPVSDGAQEGDLVTINYTGTIDGKTFEQGVIGMKKGDTKEIDIDFPSDYGDSIVAGQNVSYKVTVQNVRRVAELTDEWVAKNTDYTTVDEYKEGVRAQLEQDAKDSAEEVLKSTAWSTVLENSEVKEYPQEDLDNAVSEFKSSMEVYAKQADMTLEEFVESQGISQDDFDEQCTQYAEGKVKQNLIVQGIMDAEGISLDDKESLQVQNELVKQMEAGSLAELVSTYGQNYVDESVGLLRVEKLIVDNANVSEKVSEGDTVAENADAVADTDTQDEESVTDQEMEEELGTENVDGAETE